MEIKLSSFKYGEVFFEIITENYIYNTSKNIANLLNLDINLYNNLLIEKVIKHNNYTIESFPVVEPKRAKDLLFRLDSLPKETYINRFKETFTNQLTLITLGGA